jgi:hypothetical protein
MKRLPLLIDDQTPLLVRAGIWALVPLVFVALLPIVLLFVIVLYLSAVFHGVRVLVTVVTRKQPTADFEMPKPHFLEIQEPTRQLADQSATEPRTQGDLRPEPK